MRFFDGFVLNTIFLLFPLFIYLIFIVYKSSENKNTINSYFDIALLLSLFLLTRFGYFKSDYYISILINIPLLFAYLKGRRLIALIISIILMVYSIIIFGYNPLIVVFEYVTYFVIYLVFNNKPVTSIFIINYFTIIKSFVLSFLTFYCIGINNTLAINLLSVIITIAIFYMTSICYYYLIQKIEDFITLNGAIKELEKEKTIRNSLFRITHEIKNPIAVCKGYLDMIDLNNEDKVNKYIPIVKSEINRTLLLMDDFLDYSKVKIDKDIIDIIMLLEELVRSIDGLLKDNDISINLDIIDDEIYIMADYNRLKQVFINIIKNSMEAKMENKKMVISIKTELVNDKIKIIISDNGIGMTSEELAHMGEVFYTTKCNGTGIGVNLSKEIIERHEGTLKYSSLKYLGTDVIVELPLNKELNFI